MPMEGAPRGLMDSHEFSSTYNFYDTELTLGLPGEGRAPPSATKTYKNNEIETPSATVQAIGWPPVRSFRRKAMEKCKFVKVGADGTPYLRKVDLDMYNGYQGLLKALEDMFTCCIHCEGDKVTESTRGMEYVPTYEDKDGDCMLVGDVPWKILQAHTFDEKLRKGWLSTTMNVLRTVVTETMSRSWDCSLSDEKSADSMKRKEAS